MAIWIIGALTILLIAVVLHDVVQRKHAILHNFPVIGHFRYWLEAIGPELRQYIVTNNDEELPFSRDQRRWVYASSKKENNYFGFGSDNDMESGPNYLIIKHSSFPLPDLHAGHPGYDPAYSLPCAKEMGAYRQRARRFRPASVVNISAMSYGSLSRAAIEALNRGAKIAGVLHNTGEGGVSTHHLHGGDLIWQLGTGYFGCREADGGFSMPKLLDTVQEHRQIRALEIKLSQGAKPGVGGILPGRKVTPEIAEVRGIPLGRDCLSPSAHTSFHDVDSLLDFVEHLAGETGLPVGIKSAVGETAFWEELARLMATTERGVDFITIDGGEGGTGAGPLVFTDHVALPFKMAFPRVFRAFAEQGMDQHVVFIGSGKLGLPEAALLAFGIGSDMINIAREAMLAIGCIQAQRCHTGHCPTGIATHNPWLVRGLDPTLKAARFANYVVVLRKELIRLSRACGEVHPGLVRPDQLEILNDHYGSMTARVLFDYDEGWGLPSAEDQIAIRHLMAPSHAVA